MNLKHLLLTHDIYYKQRKEIIPPLNYFYDRQLGAWLSQGKATLLINDPSFPSIATKKKDIETGEDEKGR